MSLITRCPACGTMFKVVPDQLRISEGWVRCGHCAEVFDASSHMQGEAATATAAATAPALPEPVPPVPVQPEAASMPMAPVYAQPPEPEPEPELEPPSLAVEDLRVEPLMPAGPAQQASYLDAVDELSRAVPDTEQEAPSLEDVSFVRQARRKAFWGRPLVRAVLGLLAVVLLAALGLQIAVQERDRLAAAQPGLKPLLLQLCEPLQCTVGPPRQIEAVVIDGSTFSKLRADAYRLNFTLRNQAPTEIAMPAIELTLTDSQDQPVLRRVLTPADLGVLSGTLAAGADWSGNLAMSVAGNGTGRIAGYRVLAFYP
ncbi:MAG: DUF3426 domain-containing protein [Ramlibacter sp.]